MVNITLLFPTEVVSGDRFNHSSVLLVAFRLPYEPTPRNFHLNPKVFALG